MLKLSKRTIKSLKNKQVLPKISARRYKIILRSISSLAVQKKSAKNILKSKKISKKFSFIARNSKDGQKSPYRISNSKILGFLKQNNMQYKISHTGQISVKECTMCSKHHKNQSDNFYTLNFKPNDGAFLCFRCGSYGSWYDFVRYMLGDDVNFEKEPHSKKNINEDPGDHVNEYEMRNKTMMVIGECNSAYENLLEIEKFLENLINDESSSIEEFSDNQRILSLSQSCNYLIGEQTNDQRFLSFETLKKFKIGLGEEAFKDEDGLMRRLPVIYFPFFRPSKNKKKEDFSHLCDENYEAVKLKMRAVGKEYKRFQRFKPSGGHFGVFGLNTIEKDSKVIVITEGEYDAMAVYQATKMPSVSLPNGASHLPVQLLELIEKFERVYLWMDNDEIGLQNVENFSNKIGVKRTYLVRPDPELGIKDANDALRQGSDVVRQCLSNAKTLPSDNIIKFDSIREQVKDRLYNLHLKTGIKSSYFPWYNKVVKGFRRGELTIFTGPTGSGKTTFLSQLSLDFAKSGMPTLWCSFELKNEVLMSTMISQYAGTDLNKNPEKFDYFADRFEQIPLYLQTYFGSTDVEKVLTMLEYAIYAYDIGHIVIDNLQFMLSGQGTGFQRYEIQDDVISRFRQLATHSNVHITLVIHPRKGEDDMDLSLNSVFGTAKSTQEADNVMILQYRPKYKVIDVKKNRFDGEIGKVSLWFDKGSKRFEQMGTKEIEALISGAEVEEVLRKRERREGTEEELQVKQLDNNDHVGTQVDKEIETLFSEAAHMSEKKIEKKKKGIILKIISDEPTQEVEEVQENLYMEDPVFEPVSTPVANKVVNVNQTQNQEEPEAEYKNHSFIEEMLEVTKSPEPKDQKEEDESIEEFKNSLFEPSFVQETVSVSPGDDLINSLNKNKSSEPQEFVERKLQGFSSNDQIKQIDNLYEDGDTILTYNDIIGDLTESKKNYRSNPKEYENYKTVKSKSSIKFSQTSDDDDFSHN